MKNPNRKFSLRFGKEETGTEDKRRRLRRLVPSWSFLTRLRRPYLFSRKRKDRGEKSAWRRVWCVLRLSSGKHQCFRRRSIRESPYVCFGTRRLIRYTRFADSCLRTTAINRRCGGNPDGCYLLAEQWLPLRGEAVAVRRLMRWTATHKRKCPHLIRHGFAVPPSPCRGRH